MLLVDHQHLLNAVLLHQRCYLRSPRVRREADDVGCHQLLGHKAVRASVAISSTGSAKRDSSPDRVLSIMVAIRQNKICLREQAELCTILDIAGTAEILYFSSIRAIAMTAVFGRMITISAVIRSCAAVLSKTSLVPALPRSRVRPALQAKTGRGAQ